MATTDLHDVCVSRYNRCSYRNNTPKINKYTLFVCHRLFYSILSHLIIIKIEIPLLYHGNPVLPLSLK
jgi:hypothetical protein